MIIHTLAHHSLYLLPAERIIDLEDHIVNRIVAEMETRQFLSTEFNTKTTSDEIAELGRQVEGLKGTANKNEKNENTYIDRFATLLLLLCSMKIWMTMIAMSYQLMAAPAPKIILILPRLIL